MRGAAWFTKGFSWHHRNTFSYCHCAEKETEAQRKKEIFPQASWMAFHKYSLSTWSILILVKGSSPSANTYLVFATCQALSLFNPSSNLMKWALHVPPLLQLQNWDSEKGNHLTTVIRIWTQAFMTLNTVLLTIPLHCSASHGAWSHASPDASHDAYPMSPPFRGNWGYTRAILECILTSRNLYSDRKIKHIHHELYNTRWKVIKSQGRVKVVSHSRWQRMARV